MKLELGQIVHFKHNGTIITGTVATKEHSDCLGCSDFYVKYIDEDGDNSAGCFDKRHLVSQNRNGANT